MKYKTITIDLAKNVFQVCGVNEHIKPQFNKKLKRNELLDFMRQQSPTMVVMEACYSSHYWGRELAKLGHDTKLIPAQQIKGVRVSLNELYSRINKTRIITSSPKNSFRVHYDGCLYNSLLAEKRS